VIANWQRSWGAPYNAGSGKAFVVYGSIRRRVVLLPDGEDFAGMSGIWALISKPKNRAVIQWVGGGVIAVATGGWVVVTYVWPIHEAAAPGCVQQGVSVVGNVSGSSITNNAVGATNSSPCVQTSGK
jgi:hypothetical protein